MANSWSATPPSGLAISSFFARPATPHDAGVDVLEADRPVRQLRRHRPVADDRPRDQLRKIHDVERERHRRTLRIGDAAVDVDQIGQDVEGDERDAQRQRHVRVGKRPAEDRLEHHVEVVDQEVGVLEQDQDEEISRDRPLDQPLAPLAVGRRDRLTEHEVGGDRRQHQDDRDPAAPHIKHHAGGDQHQVADRVRRAMVERKNDRQKQADEGQITENHRVPCLPPTKSVVPLFHFQIEAADQRAPQGILARDLGGVFLRRRR